MAEQVVGGVAADVVWPPGNNFFQSFDNLRFQAEVSSFLGDEVVLLQARADGSKVGHQFLPIDASNQATWHARTMWPIPGNHTLSFHYFVEDQFFEADGNSVLTRQRLHPNVHVYGVQFWAVSGASAGAEFLSDRVDSLAAPIPSRTANTIDGIFGQCGGLDKTQFRGHPLRRFDPTIDPPGPSTCSDLRGVVRDHCDTAAVCGSGDIGACSALESCVREFADALFADDASRGQVHAHVFSVETTPCGELGRNIPIVDGSGRQRSMMLTTNHSDATIYTTILAHEMAHDVFNGHCNDGTPESQVHCEPSDCTSSDPNQRNLMCRSGNGRRLTSAQCDRLRQGMSWDDIN